MTSRRGRSVGLATVFALAAALSGCGGFGSAEPTTSASSQILSYVALGDGFASAPYQGRDTSGTGCLRGADNYPAAVARALKIRTFRDETCVGATTKALTSGSSAPGSAKKLPAQLDAVTKSTNLVTITVGIEDNNFLQNMFHICQTEPCGKNVLGPPMFDQLDALGKTVTTEVRTIQAVAPTATIVIVGYPQIMPTTGLCSGLPKITDTQLGYASVVLAKLNSLLLSATQQTGASFVDAAALSTNHTVCSNVPWVSGYKSVKGHTQAFHPSAAEQKAVAAAVVAQVRSGS